MPCACIATENARLARYDSCLVTVTNLTFGDQRMVAMTRPAGDAADLINGLVLRFCGLCGREYRRVKTMEATGG